MAGGAPLAFASMADERPWAGRRLHLIGLGGAGMSGYARVATQLGAAVSGSDRADSAGLRALAGLGVDVHVGHDAANVPAGDGVEVVHSTAIPDDNPERAAARERNLRRAHALQPLMQPVSPHRWRALPTVLLVIVALALGAATARADDGSAPRAAASTSSAIR